MNANVDSSNGTHGRYGKNRQQKR